MRFVLGGVERTIGEQRCVCPEAQEHWARVDEQEAKEKSAREESERKQRVQAAFQNSMLPARWHNRTFDAFESTWEKETALQAARRYAEEFNTETTDGLLFTGTVGTGKTHLAAAIALSLIERGDSVVFGTVATLLGQIRNSYDDDKVTERQVLDRLTNSRLLIIDDLGKEKVSEWVDQTVYEIINTRYELNKPLIITTNMRLADIRKHYVNNGDAIVDRILEMCRCVEMKWPSWRKRALQ